MVKIKFLHKTSKKVGKYKSLTWKKVRDEMIFMIGNFKQKM